MHGFKFLRIALPVLLLAAAAILLIPPWIQKERARNDLLPAIQKWRAPLRRLARGIDEAPTVLRERLVLTLDTTAD
ncbi:MAG: hypothetical protein ACYDBZ_18875 [Steroidobacteraceae bacterium]